MLAACVSGDLASTEQHITSLASLGLRTLVLGHKTISEEQWTAFSLALDTTSQSLVNRWHVNMSTWLSCQHVTVLPGPSS